LLKRLPPNGVMASASRSQKKDLSQILMTSIASNSAFSTGSRIMSKYYQSSMKTKTLEALVCGQDCIYYHKAGLEPIVIS
jgi:hypothetical protein